MLRLCSLLVGAVLLLSGSLSAVRAQSAAQAAAAANDLVVLNYALTLEHLESTFYDMGLAKFAQADFTAEGFPSNVSVMLSMIQAHEAFHVAFLSEVITQSGGVAVPACTYDFSSAMGSATAFITTAAVLENTGQAAYDGAVNGISNPVYAEAAADIVTVEARHAAYLNQLTGALPFPNAFDPALAPAAVAAAITPFLVHCNYTIELPTVRPTGVSLSSSGAVVSTGSIPSTYSAVQQANDLVALNYALTLEHFEDSFYYYVSTHFTSAMFTAAGFPAYYYDYSQMIGQQEATHVAALTAVINGRPGGVAVGNCTYDFSSIVDVPTYLAVADVLENTGVMAYDGAVNSITDTALQQVASTIATVEARHAAFLNEANYKSPFPTELDNGTAPALIIGAVLKTGLLTGCSYTVVGPQVLPLFGSSVLGDPAFTGFNGQTFQVHGIPDRFFSLLTTPSSTFNAKFVMIEDGEAMTAGQMRQARLLSELGTSKSADCSGSPLPLTTAFSHAGTFLGQLGLQYKQHRLFIQAGRYCQGFSKVQLDGQDVAVGSAPHKLDESASFTLSSAHELLVETADFSFTLVNSDGFVNIQQATLNRAWTDDWQIEGLLGQTADPAWTPSSSKSFKMHMVFDYLIADSTDIFSVDFVSNMFDRAAVANSQ